MNFTLESSLPKLVPVLPLDGHVLLPSAATPFRVSDPRHRRLVLDLVERPLNERWVAVPPRIASARSDRVSPMPDVIDEEVATLGLITVATPLEGGEFIVVVEGRGACRLETLDHGGGHPYAVPYAVARIRHLADRPEPLHGAHEATTGLIQALFALYESFGLAATELPQSDLALDDIGLVYRVGSSIIEDPVARAMLLCERCPARRREQVLGQIVDQMAFAMREKLLGRQAESC
jgi:Lon protease-like protein